MERLAAFSVQQKIFSGSSMYPGIKKFYRIPRGLSLHATVRPTAAASQHTNALRRSAAAGSRWLAAGSYHHRLPATGCQPVAASSQQPAAGWLLVAGRYQLPAATKRHAPAHNPAYFQPLASRQRLLIYVTGYPCKVEPHAPQWPVSGQHMSGIYQE